MQLAVKPISSSCEGYTMLRSQWVSEKYCCDLSFSLLCLECSHWYGRARSTLNWFIHTVEKYPSKTSRVELWHRRVRMFSHESTTSAAPSVAGTLAASPTTNHWSPDCSVGCTPVLLRPSTLVISRKWNDCRAPHHQFVRIHEKGNSEIYTNHEGTFNACWPHEEPARVEANADHWSFPQCINGWHLLWWTESERAATGVIHWFTGPREHSFESFHSFVAFEHLWIFRLRIGRYTLISLKCFSFPNLLNQSLLNFQTHPSKAVLLGSFSARRQATKFRYKSNLPPLRLSRFF